MNSYADLMKGMQSPLINGGANPGSPMPPMEIRRNGNQVSIVPHIRTFNSIAQWMSRTYRFRFDEALQRNYNSAKAMRNDAFIQGLYRKRMTPVTKSDFTIESDGPDASEEVNAFYKSILEQTPQWHEFRRNVLECVWFGRYGVQMAFDEQTYEGRRFEWKGRQAVGISHWLPHLGDKITFTFDFFPCIRVSPIYVSTWRSKGATVLAPNDPRVVQEAVNYRWTEEGPVVVLDNPNIRKDFVISIFEIQDAPWDEPTLAGGIRGVGLRHYTFWNWDNKQEIVGWAMNYLEEFGAGGLTVVAYDGEEGLRRQQAAFADPAQRVIFVPIIPGTEEKVTDSVTRLEPATTGNDAIMKWAQDYFGADLTVLFLGHPLNAKAGATGLGSDASNRAADDLKLINRSDAEIGDVAMSHEVLPRLKERNDHGGRYTLKFVSTIRGIDKQAGMQAADTLYKWGAKIPKAYAYMLADVPMLKPDEEYLQDPMHAQQEMQMAAQLAAIQGGQDTSYMERGAQHQDSVEGIFSGGNEATLASAREKLKGAGVPDEDILGTMAVAVQNGTVEEHDLPEGIHYTWVEDKGPRHVGQRWTNQEGDHRYTEPKALAYSIETDPSSKWTEETGPISGKPRWRNNLTGRIQYREPGHGRHVQAVDRSEGKTPGFKLDQGKFGVGVGLLPGKGLATGVVEDRVLQLAREGGKSLQGEGVLAEVMHVDKRLMKAQAISLAAKLGLQIDSKTSKTQALAHIENTLRNKAAQARGATPGQEKVPAGSTVVGKGRPGKAGSNKGDSAPLIAMTEKSGKEPIKEEKASGKPDENQSGHVSAQEKEPGVAGGQVNGLEEDTPAPGSPSFGSPTTEGEAVLEDTPGSTDHADDLAGKSGTDGPGSSDTVEQSSPYRAEKLGIPAKSTVEQVRDVAKSKYAEAKRVVEEHNSMLRSAISALLSYDDPNKKDGLFTKTGKLRREKLKEADYNDVPGFKSVANSMAGLYSGIFDPNGSYEGRESGIDSTVAEDANSEKLMDLLRNGEKEYPKLSDYENQAFQEWYDSHPGQGDAAEPEKWDDVEFDPSLFGDSGNESGQVQGDTGEQRNDEISASDEGSLQGDAWEGGDSGDVAEDDQRGSFPDDTDGQGDSGSMGGGEDSEQTAGPGEDVQPGRSGGNDGGNGDQAEEQHPSGVNPNEEQGSEAGQSLRQEAEVSQDAVPERSGSGEDTGSNEEEILPGNSGEGGEREAGFMEQTPAGKYSADDLEELAGQSFTNDQGLSIDVTKDEDGTWSVGKKYGLSAQGAANYLNELKAEKSQGLFSPEVTAQAPVAKKAEKWEWAAPKATVEKGGELPGMRDTFAPGMFGAAANRASETLVDKHKAIVGGHVDSIGEAAPLEQQGHERKILNAIDQGGWHHSADIAKFPWSKGVSPAEKGRKVYNLMEQMEKAGHIQKAWDENGDVHYAKVGVPLDDGLTQAAIAAKPSSTQKAVDTLKAGMAALQGGKANEQGKGSQQERGSGTESPLPTAKPDTQSQAADEGGSVARVEGTTKAEAESQKSGKEKYTIEKYEGTQMGYRKTGSREKNSRKLKGFMLTDPTGYQRHFDTKKEAMKYVQDNGGELHEPEAKAKEVKARWNGEKPGSVVPVGKDAPHNLGERLKGASKSKAIEMLKEVKADQWSKDDLVELGNANSMALSTQMSNNTMIGLILEKLDVRHKAVKKVLAKMEKTGSSNGTPEQVGEGSVSHYQSGMNKDYKHFTSWRDWKETVISHLKNHRDS